MKQLTRIALGLGGNLDDRRALLTAAVQRVAEEFLFEARASSFYETPPWGITAQPDFLNLVLVGDSEWKPPAILNFVKILEREMGRAPAERNGPRRIDIDLLAYGEQTFVSPEVEVPHPRMHDRDFVLVPFCEVWPEWRHPKLNKTARELLAAIERPQAKRVAPPPPIQN